MEVFIKVMNGLVMTLEEDEIFMRLAVQFVNGRAKISNKSYSMRSFCCLNVFSSSVVLGKITSIRSKRLRKKREETVKLTCFMSKVTSVPQTPQTNHSQYPSPVEPLNLIVNSKSQPVELDNSTIELHVPSR